MQTTTQVKPTGPAEIPGSESTRALALVSASTPLTLPEPTGLPARIGDAYTRAIAEVEYLLDSPEVYRRFAYLLLTHLRTTPALQACTPDSLVTAIVEMAEEHLDPSGMNECFLIAYQGQATMQRGYAGLIKLACSHPEVADLFADEVCVNDTYEFYGINSRPRHVYPGGFQPRGRYIGYYAVAQLTQDRWRAVQMSVEEIKDHTKQYSQGAAKKVWSEGAGGGFRGMALKTVIRKLCNPKYLPMAARVYEKLRQQDVVEGVILDPMPSDARVPLTLREPGKTRADHIADLTGQPPAPPAGPLAGDYVAQIEALLVTHGRTIPAFWGWAEKQKKKPQVQFSAADYTDLLARVQADVQKPRAQRTAPEPPPMAQDETSAPDAPTETSVPPESNQGPARGLPEGNGATAGWREMLAGLVPSLDDATLAQAAGSVLEDAEVSAETGNAMVSRVLDALETQDERTEPPL